MKFLNFVLPLLTENALASSFYKLGNPGNAYYITQKAETTNDQCNCEVFCATYSDCTYFAVGGNICYLYNSGTLSGWIGNPGLNTYKVGSAATSDCFNGVFNININEADGTYWNFYTGVFFKVMIENAWYVFN